jgi:hypothetical protein
MRLGFLGVTLCLVSVVAAACGGNALEPDAGEGFAEGDAETTTPVDSDGAPLAEGYVSHCEELAAALKDYVTCTNQPASEGFFEDVQSQCERHTAQTPTRCASEFRELTRCQARGLEACERGGSSCESQEQAYAGCVSGGYCHDVGGGSGGALPNGLDVFTDHLACQCVEEELQEKLQADEDRAAVADGTACNTADDCPTVCCPCSSPNTEYSAAVCDKSSTGGAGPGVCATDEAACAATSFRCAEMS